MKDDSWKEKADELIGKILHLIFFCSMNLAMVLYYHHAYFDIMEAKADLFHKIRLFLLPVMALYIVYRLLRKKMIKRLSFSDISSVVFLVSSAVSCFFSYSVKDAWSGAQGWYVGFEAILFFIVCLFALKGKKIEEKHFLYFTVPVFLIECVLSIAGGFDLDLLHMREGLSLSSHYSYFGTVGNSNWFAGYLSLLVPLFLCRFISSEKRGSSVFYFILSFLGLFVSILIDVNSIYLAYGFLMPLILPFVLKDGKRVKRISVLLLFLSFSLYLFKIYGSVSYFSLVDGLTAVLFEHILWAVLFCMAFCIVSFLVKEERYEKNGIVKVAEVSFVLLFCAALFFMVKRGEGDLTSRRMELWRLSFAAFKKFDPFMKLFGIGEELLRNVYAPMSSKYGVVYNASHSEPIQILLTMGIFGFVSWSCCWIAVTRTFFQKNRTFIGFYAGLLAYLGQSLVNSAVLMNLGILICFVLFVCQKDVD